ncbi:hypothetical protein DID88_002812 [Monilinia fructigena]|uniref:Uncharacterized protein n=1 Tax=Monilinia fructigena TaxID=38457 RepID=A0A395INR8_9HELO|nr:hypothetical protein DID88_002812 [Monilinia fructigena]
MPTAYKNSFWPAAPPSICASKHAAVPASSPAATITALNTATMMTTLPVMAGAVAGTVSLPSEDFHLYCKCSIVRRCKNNMISKEMPAPDAWDPAAAPAVN